MPEVDVAPVDHFVVDPTSTTCRSSRFATRSARAVISSYCPAHTTPGLALAPRRLTGKPLMYHQWHATNHGSYVTRMSGEECP